MYKSLGNILENPKVGLLFMKFGAEEGQGAAGEEGHVPHVGARGQGAPVTLDLRHEPPGEPALEAMGVSSGERGGVGPLARGARAHPVDKSTVPPEVAELRSIFMKSVVALRDLDAGTVLQASDLGSKKPGSGIPANDLPQLLGRKLARRVERDALLAWEDLED